jgi:hypothetical protein
LINDELTRECLRDSRDPTETELAELVTFPKIGELSQTGTWEGRGTDGVGQ